MKIYYQDDLITIIHADCRDVIDQLPDYSLLLTDPPYGVDFKGKATKDTKAEGGYISGDNELGPEIVARFLPKVERGMVFTGIRLLYRYPEPYDIGCVFNPAGAGRGRWGFTCFNPILFYGPRPKYKNGGCIAASLLSSSCADGQTKCGHPCPKPMEWMHWCLRLAGEGIETIIDPFAGSGTTGRAAKDFGIKATLIEIEEEYCEIAAKRMSQSVLFKRNDIA